MNHYQNGYDDFWKAKYNPPASEIDKQEYLRGYHSAQHNFVVGNY